MGLFLPLYSIVPCPSLWKFSYMIKCFFSCSNHKGPTVPPGFVFTIYHISFCHFKLIITLWEEIMCRKTFMYICTHIYTQYLKYINQISVEIYKKIFNQITWNLQKKSEMYEDRYHLWGHITNCLVVWPRYITSFVGSYNCMVSGIWVKVTRNF